MRTNEQRWELRRKLNAGNGNGRIELEALTRDELLVEARYWREQHERGRQRLAKLWVAYRELEAEMERLLERSVAETTRRERERPGASGGPTTPMAKAPAEERAGDPAGRAAPMRVVPTTVIFEVPADRIRYAGEGSLDPSPRQSPQATHRKGRRKAQQPAPGVKRAARTVRPGKRRNRGAKATKANRKPPADRPKPLQKATPKRPSGLAREPRYPVGLYRIERLPGVASKEVRQLKDYGVNLTDELLHADLLKLAKATKIPRTRLERYRALSELMAIKGIGETWAKTLVDAGVRTIPQLARLTPKELSATLLERYKRRRIPKKRLEVLGRTLPARATSLVRAARDAAATL